MPPRRRAETRAEPGEFGRILRTTDRPRKDHEEARETGRTQSEVAPPPFEDPLEVSAGLNRASTLASNSASPVGLAKVGIEAHSFKTSWLSNPVRNIKGTSCEVRAAHTAPQSAAPS